MKHKICPYCVQPFFTEGRELYCSSSCQKKGQKEQRRALKGLRALEIACRGNDVQILRYARSGSSIRVEFSEAIHVWPGFPSTRSHTIAKCWTDEVLWLAWVLLPGEQYAAVKPRLKKVMHG